MVEIASSSGTVLASYTQGPNIDEPLALVSGTTASYYQEDGLGSVTSLSGSSGSVAQTYTYDSFGNQTASTGSLPSFFRYAGRDFDPEVKLYYDRARYYDPATGRFASEDPISFNGGLNFYAYVDNDSPNVTDPFGFCGICDNVPPHPQAANLDVNIRAAQQNGYKWWYEMVKTKKGPWDYKWFLGKPHPEYDDYGNFNFGATGAGLGIPLDILLRGAGWAKSNDNFGSPLGKYPYGNQPDKQEQIIRGYEWFQMCKTGIAPGLAGSK